jgi:hypothetical protein
MKMSLRCLLIWSVLSPYAIAAQTPVLPPPTRIRYSLPGGQPVVAEVLVQLRDSLWVRPERTADTVVLSVPSLSRLDVSLGRSGHGRRGAGIGFLTGVVLGGALGLASGDDPKDSCDGRLYCYKFSARDKALLYGGLLGLLGSGVGAIVGANQKTDRWEPVLLTTIRANATQFGFSERRYQAGVRVTVF